MQNFHKIFLSENYICGLIKKKVCLQNHIPSLNLHPRPCNLLQGCPLFGINRVGWAKIHCEHILLDCIFVRQTPDYYAGYRRVQIVKDEYIGKPMPVINPPQATVPSVEETKLSNTRKLIDKFYAKNPQELSKYMEYYSHSKTHNEPEVTINVSYGQSYIEKEPTNSADPFSFLKLMKRVQALQRRCEGYNEPVISRRSQHACLSNILVLDTFLCSDESQIFSPSHSRSEGLKRAFLMKKLLRLSPVNGKRLKS